MIFFGKDFWTEQIPIFPLLKDLTHAGMYKNLILSITDDPEEVISQLMNFRRERENR
jgi:hypothetical protein